MNFNININGTFHQVDIDENTPLLWVIRDIIDLKGTKYGCGKGACGACTVHVGDQAIRSCSYPIKYLKDQKVTTIEGLAPEGELHPVQQAWHDEIVPQCGYCQPGFIMATAALLQQNDSPTDEDIDNNIVNICRCGTYYRMRKAIHRAADLSKKEM